jgi:hypothetical protein
MAQRIFCIRTHDNIIVEKSVYKRGWYHESSATTAAARDRPHAPLVAYEQCACKKTSHEVAALAGFLIPYVEVDALRFLQLEGAQDPCIPACPYAAQKNQYTRSRVNREVIMTFLFFFFNLFYF